MPGPGRMGAKRWNQLVDDIVESFFRQRDVLEQAMLIDGYPPFTEPVSEQEQYQQLISMRDSGDPGFWNNPQAVKDLERLSARYGDPDPPIIGAYGEESNVGSPQSLYERYV